MVVDERGRILIACGCGTSEGPFLPSRLARLLMAVCGLAGQETFSQVEIADQTLEIVKRKQFLVVLIPYRQGEEMLSMEALHIAHMLEVMYKSYFEREQRVQDDCEYCVQTELNDPIELEVHADSHTLPDFLEFQDSYLSNALLEEPACKKWLLPLARLESIFQVDLVSAEALQRFLTLSGLEHGDNICSICEATTCSAKLWSLIFEKILTLTEDSRRQLAFQWRLPTHHDHELCIFLQPLEVRACGLSLCLVVIMVEGSRWGRKAGKADSDQGFFQRLQERMALVMDAIAVAFPSSSAVRRAEDSSSQRPLMPIPPKRHRSDEAPGSNRNRFRARHLKEPDIAASSRRQELGGTRDESAVAAARAFKGLETEKSAREHDEVPGAAAGERSQTLRSSRLWQDLGFTSPRKQDVESDTSPFGLVELYKGTPDKPRALSFRSSQAEALEPSSTLPLHMDLEQPMQGEDAVLVSPATNLSKNLDSIML